MNLILHLFDVAGEPKSLKSATLRCVLWTTRAMLVSVLYYYNRLIFNCECLLKTFRTQHPWRLRSLFIRDFQLVIGNSL